MAKRNQPSTATQGNTTSSPDKPSKTSKNDTVELTEDELKKVSGGNLTAGNHGIIAVL
jgi:bacteriocin-like protein